MKQKLQALCFTLLLLFYGGATILRANAAGISIPQEGNEVINLSEAVTAGTLTYEGLTVGDVFSSIRNGNSATLSLSNTKTRDLLLCFKAGTKNEGGSPKVTVTLSQGETKVLEETKDIKYTQGYNTDTQYQIYIKDVPAGELSLKFSFFSTSGFVCNLGYIGFYSVPQIPEESFDLNSSLWTFGKTTEENIKLPQYQSGNQNIGYVYNGGCMYGYPFNVTEAGLYNLSMGIRKNANGQFKLTVSDYWTGEEEMTETFDVPESSGYATQFFKLTKPLTVGLKAMRLDFIAGEGVSSGTWIFNFNNMKFEQRIVTVGSTGFATVGLPYATTLPEGVKGYAVTNVTETAVTLTEVPAGTNIAANTGLIIVAAPGSYTFPVVESGVKIEGNVLVANTEVDKIAETEGEFYVLAVTDEAAKTVGLAQIAQGGVIAKNRAYMPASVVPAGVSGQTSGLRLVFGDPTAVEEVAESDAEAVETVVYNLAGQRVNANAKGLVVVKGRKYLKK